MNVAPTREGPRVNQEIGVPRVRLVDERGNVVGVIGRNEALDMAVNAGLDLVEVAPNADPPVCKILDYGKFKYEEQKKKNEARKKQKIIEVKEIKLRPSIDDPSKTFSEVVAHDRPAGTGPAGPAAAHSTAASAHAAIPF